MSVFIVKLVELGEFGFVVLAFLYFSIESFAEGRDEVGLKYLIELPFMSLKFI